jgi:hypothetical protein
VCDPPAIMIDQLMGAVIDGGNTTRLHNLREVL